MMVLAHSQHYLSISDSLLNSVLVIHSLPHSRHSFFILTIIYQVCLSICAVSFVTCTMLFFVLSYVHAIIRFMLWCDSQQRAQ